MPKSFHRIGALLMKTVDKCQRDNTPMLAAGLSFYAMLSLAPALWIVVAATGAIIGRDSANSAAIAWITRNIGPNVAQYLESIMAEVGASGKLATIGGAVATFLGATAAFSALQDSLNRIWHQPDTSDIGLLDAIKGAALGFFTRRLLAFGIMLLLGALLLASLLASAALTFLASYVPSSLPAPALLLLVVDFLVSVFLMMLLFSAIYHMLRRKTMRGKGVWIGAAVTAVLFAIGKALISQYLGGAGVRGAYGAAGSFVVLLLWIYYSAQILLFGAEFTEVYSRKVARQ
jgi:membrane protein